MATERLAPFFCWAWVPVAEGFWSLIKRGCVCTFHKVSKKYLHLYVAAFQFRYNDRHNEDIFGTAIEGC
jgi:hypothetical protein